MAQWSKEQRDKANRDRLALVAIAVDATTPPHGSKLGKAKMTASAASSAARKVLAFLEQIFCDRAKRLKRRKQQRPQAQED